MGPTNGSVEENDLQKAIAGMAGASAAAPGGGGSAQASPAADAPMGAAFMGMSGDGSFGAPAPEPTSQPSAPSFVPPASQNPETPSTPSPSPSMSFGGSDLEQVKMSALNDLKPIIDRVNISPEDKFKIYKEILEEAPDKAVIEPAYGVAKQISDESERAEALLFVVQKIDEMK
jgi:hypothetical protein